MGFAEARPGSPDRQQSLKQIAPPSRQRHLHLVQVRVSSARKNPTRNAGALAQLNLRFECPRVPFPQVNHGRAPAGIRTYQLGWQLTTIGEGYRDPVNTCNDVSAGEDATLARVDHQKTLCWSRSRWPFSALARKEFAESHRL
jgi:hypothetical protein